MNLQLFKDDILNCLSFIQDRSIDNKGCINFFIIDIWIILYLFLGIFFIYLEFKYSNKNLRDSVKHRKKYD